MLPVLPALLAVSLMLLAAPFPWVESGGLPPASTTVPAAGVAAASTAGAAAPVGAVAVAPRQASPAGRPSARLGPAGPVPSVVGPVLVPYGPFPPLVGPELGRSGLTSAVAPPVAPVPAPPPAAAAVVPAPIAVAVPVPVVPPLPVPVTPRATVPPSTVPPPPAAAPGVEVDPAGGDWLRRRATDALAQISFPWQALGYDVAFLPARSGVRARTLRVDTRIEVFARRSDSARQTAFDLAHEIAHAVDFQWATWEPRERWQAARGIDPSVAWFGCNGCADLATPAGDFAESFALWQVPGGPFHSALGPPPDEAQRALLAELTAPA